MWLVVPSTCWCSLQFSGCLLAVEYHVTVQQKFTADLCVSLLILLGPDKTSFYLSQLGLSWLKLFFRKIYFKTGMTYTNFKTLMTETNWMFLLWFSGTPKSCSFKLQTQWSPLPLQHQYVEYQTSTGSTWSVTLKYISLYAVFFLHSCPRIKKEMVDGIVI